MAPAAALAARAGPTPAALGTELAFAIPGVLMFLATFIFWLGRRKFVHVPPKPGGGWACSTPLSSVCLFLAVGHLFFTPSTCRLADLRGSAR